MEFDCKDLSSHQKNIIRGDNSSEREKSLMMNPCGCDEGLTVMTVNWAASRGTAATRSISRTKFN